MDDSGWHVLLNKVLHYQSESSGCCGPSVGIFWILLLAPWGKKKDRKISSHSFKQLNLWMRPWFCRIKPDLRLKTVENCWRQDQFQVQVVMGTLMASRFRGRELSKKNKSFILQPGSFLLAHSRVSPRSGYVSRLMGPTLPGNTKYCLRFFYSLRGE